MRLLILATISLLTLAQFGASAPFTLFGDRKDATSAPAVQEAVDSTKPVAWEASTFDKVAGYLQVPKVKLEQMFSKLFQKEEDIYKPKKDAEKIARKIRNGRGTPEQKALKIVEATGTNAPDEDWKLVIRLAKGDGALQDQARKVLVDINAALWAKERWPQYEEAMEKKKAMEIKATEKKAMEKDAIKRPKVVNGEVFEKDAEGMTKVLLDALHP